MTDSPKMGKEALGVMIDKLSQIVYSKGQPASSSNSDVSTSNSETTLITNIDNVEPIAASDSSGHTGDSVTTSVVNNNKSCSVTSVIQAQSVVKSSNDSDRQARTTVVPVLIVPKLSTDSPKPLNDSNDGTCYQCSMCEYKSHNKHYLKQHVDLVHVSNRPFKCPFCDYAGKRSQALKEHLVVHSNESPYSCDICSASFRKKGHLTSHIRLHGNVRTFECNICHQEFGKRKFLYGHLRECHPSHNVYACDLCEYTTTIKSNIIMHMHTHSNPKSYQCNQCDFKAIHINLLNQHLRQHTSSGGDKADIKMPQVVMLKCTECGFTADCEDVLRNHMWTHIDSVQRNDVTLPGTTVESVTKSKTLTHHSKVSDSDMVLHSLPQLPVMYKADGAVTIYKCTECNFSSGEAYAFITHMLSHKPRFPKAINKPLNSENSSFVFDSDQRVFRCLICGYACEHQRTIKSHIWKHSGHKKIEYPMFQNGPLSLYDSEEENEFMPSLESKVDSRKKTESINLLQLLKNPAKSPSSTPPVASIKNSILCPTGPSSDSLLPKTVLESPSHPVLISPQVVSAFLPGRILKTPSQSSVSSVGSSVEKRSSEEIESFSKRFCKGDGKNVIVETLNDIYTTPKFVFSYSNHSSPRTVDSAPTSDVVIETAPVTVTTSQTDKPSQSMTNSSLISKTETITTSPMNSGTESFVEVVNSSDLTRQGEETVETTADNESVTTSQEEAVTLLSLLKKGPNFNPACPTVIPGAPKLSLPKKRKRNAVDETEETTILNKESPGKADSVASDASKSKSGICSSLLAVIEQLRERSTSESENDDRASVSTRSSSRKLVTVLDGDDDWLKDYPNVERVSGNDAIYRCKLCHYSNTSCSLMKQHMVVHKSKQPFECSLCDFMADSSEDLQDHMIQHCKARTYQCKTCTANFSYKSQLRAHMRISHMSVPQSTDHDVFMCDECDFVAVKFSELQMHMENHGGCKSEGSETKSELGTISGYSKKEKTVRCDQCDYVCFSNSRMKQHQHVHEDGPIKCDQCDFTAISTRSLKSHMKRHVNDQRYVQQPLEQYKCGLCGYVCHHLPSLKSHMWRHAGDANYQYEVTNNAINAAIDYELGKNSDSDSQTGKDDPKEGGSGNGSTSKNGLVRFRCCECGFETVDKTSLQEHMMEHVNKTSEADGENKEKKDKEGIE